MRFLPLLLVIGLCGCMSIDNHTPPRPGPDDGEGSTPPGDEIPPGDDPADPEPTPEDPAPEDPGEEDDPPTRPVEPEEDPPTDPIDDEDPLDGGMPPGGACACDDDCRNDGTNPGLCIHGICGARATDDACPAGSTAACPAGLRCWSGTGQGVCYPDYVPGECAGREDGDGSCVSDGSRDCYRGCGTLCDLPGTPDDTDPDPDPDPDPPTGDLTPQERDLLDALNAERASYGLPPVAADDRLMCAARRHALDVGSTGTCEHVGSDGSWPWDRAEACGFPQEVWTVNEIAAGPGFSDGADAVWGWRHSPGHHAAIVHADARFVGVGVHATCFIALFDCCVAGS